MSDLPALLERSRELGFLGPGPVEDHIAHAEWFAQAHQGPPPARALDLGSGGGLPGLVLAQRWPKTAWWLLDANERRTRFLTDAVRTLGLEDRVAVLHGRAETMARDAGLRHGFELVTSRSFGPPAVTAECATAFLEVDGELLVSEPPLSAGRWAVEGLALLGMEIGPAVAGCQVLRQVVCCSDRYPRRVGIPRKRPLF
jgi:16S rRNA (guanine527-N7)-methyltransferase